MILCEVGIQGKIFNVKCMGTGWSALGLSKNLKANRVYDKKLPLIYYKVSLIFFTRH